MLQTIISIIVGSVFVLFFTWLSGSESGYRFLQKLDPILKGNDLSERSNRRRSCLYLILVIVIGGAIAFMLYLEL